MRKKVLVYVLIIFMIILPISVYAENNVDSNYDANYKANVTLKYNKEEQKKLENIPNVGCKAVYIANPDTGKVIYEKNAHEKMYPASTTKVLTALLTLENCKMTDKAVVSQHAIDLVPEGYSNASLKAKEEHTIKDLLYALLLPSANEAANVLAEHISGSIEEFAQLCNKRAKELGCETLNFVNANGLHDENHYCSAYDLYLIAKECQKYDVFNEIVKTKTYSLPSTKLYTGKRILNNTNELLLPGTYYYSHCTGIKTGHTTPAGECLVASSSYNDMNLICVVLGGNLKNSLGLNERFYDTKKLFEFTYNNYSIKQIAKYGQSVATIKVKKASKENDIVDAIVDTNISAILPNDIEKENISSEISINEDIVAPIKKNQVLGQITYYADGIAYTTNVIAGNSVEMRIWVQVLVVTLLIFGIVIIIILICRKCL